MAALLHLHDNNDFMAHFMAHFKFCMIMMSSKFNVCFIVPEKRVLTTICDLHQTFSYCVVYSEHFHIGGIF